ncbi:MAG: ribosome maturation factor RimM [Spirochaetales bacterium]|nr:ribosome maturation factor RimM [Spirochaetales bacterium]
MAATGRLEGYLAIGSIRTSHGVKGLLKVRSFSGETDHFFDLKEVTLRDKRGRTRNFAVERMALNGKDLLMKLRGVDTPELGKTFSGWEIWVPRELAASCDEGEYYFADLVGCRLYHEDKTLGTVLALTDGGGGTLMEVERPAPAEEGEKPGRFYVPFRKEFIGKVDVTEKTVELLVLWAAEE